MVTSQPPRSNGTSHSAAFRVMLKDPSLHPQASIFPPFQLRFIGSDTSWPLLTAQYCSVGFLASPLATTYSHHPLFLDNFLSELSIVCKDSCSRSQGIPVQQDLFSLEVTELELEYSTRALFKEVRFTWDCIQFKVDSRVRYTMTILL